MHLEQILKNLKDDSEVIILDKEDKEKLNLYIKRLEDLVVDLYGRIALLWI